jgi:hypothetical protein
MESRSRRATLKLYAEATAARREQERLWKLYDMARERLDAAQEQLARAEETHLRAHIDWMRASNKADELSARVLTRIKRADAKSTQTARRKKTASRPK